LPFQAGRCEGYGFHDYLEYVHASEGDAWLCRYCRETLEKDGEITLESGHKLSKPFRLKRP